MSAASSFMESIAGVGGVRTKRIVSDVIGARKREIRFGAAESSASSNACTSCHRASGFFSIDRRDHFRERVGDPVAEIANVAEHLVLLMVENGVETFAVPRPAPGEHLPAHQPKAVDVGAGIEHATVDLLGRHVGRRPERDAVHRELRLAGHRPRQAEVGEHGASFVLDEDVLRLDVAMNDAHRVRSRERRADVAHDPLGARRREGILRG